ncbi:DUF6934 family protein [Deminuibacter soli]|uniref:Uncharacterized protein n=1 Tax=Deminuibacter soli TaxID=2291815 RepID=A0A3E1NKT7_9BACT|nr:hypothetical protein [Deminuibacter soli]RFM28550.1 hypothetical protein DXN05_07035 [Deminuibacter soli]
MATRVQIDFDNTYDIQPLSDDLRISMFTSELQDGSSLPLRIEISSEPHALLESVYNLAFGPLNARNQIDDMVEITHKDYSKTFSSILLAGLAYLSDHPDQYLGIDGSNNLRAYYYYRMLQRNFNYLNEFFEMRGLKYYVRISRFGKHQYENPFDFDDVIPSMSPIEKGHVPALMFNYFTFKVRNAAGSIVDFSQKLK